MAKLILPLSILAAGFFLSATATWAVPEFARKSKKECSFCHPPTRGTSRTPGSITANISIHSKDTSRSPPISKAKISMPGENSAERFGVVAHHYR